jgi:hypothetical protein
VEQVASVLAGLALLVTLEPAEQVLAEVPEAALATGTEATGIVVVLLRVAEVVVPDITMEVEEVLVGLAVAVVVVVAA